MRDRLPYVGLAVAFLANLLNFLVLADGWIAKSTCVVVMAFTAFAAYALRRNRRAMDAYEAYWKELLEGRRD